MKALFAMDLIGAKAVRLQKGDFSKVTVYSDDPPAKIRAMVAEGAQDFHIIDLDGARTGEPVHRDLIGKIRAAVPGYMEVGGGIRTAGDIEAYTAAGVNGIIVGTKPLEDDRFFANLQTYGNIVLGVDLHEGKVMVRGWKNAAEKSMEEILSTAEQTGIMAILCTSISRDGMLSGPDYEALRLVMSRTSLPVIASGGVTTIDDVKRCKDLGSWAVILGKAVYEGLIDIGEAVSYAD